MQDYVLSPVPIPELVDLIVTELEARINRTEKTEPPQDRIDKEGVKQMTGQSNSWIYKKTMPKCKDPLPHEKFGKRLVFSRKSIQEYIDSHTKSIHTSDMIMTERLARVAKKRL
jgi:predicted DNA-binding transcriptional regulator AlpA